MWIAFDYMYRDAGNFKAFGTVVLKGSMSQADQVMVRSRLSDGEFFIAEQVGVPPLYRELYRWSGAPRKPTIAGMSLYHSGRFLRLTRNPTAVQLTSL